MIIVWDEPKRLANIDKHGLDYADLSLEFFQRALIRPAKRGRLQAIGRLADGAVAVIFVRLWKRKGCPSFRCARQMLPKGGLYHEEDQAYDGWLS